MPGMRPFRQSMKSPDGAVRDALEAGLVVPASRIVCARTTAGDQAQKI